MAVSGSICSCCKRAVKFSGRAIIRIGWTFLYMNVSSIFLTLLLQLMGFRWLRSTEDELLRPYWKKFSSFDLVERRVK
ncbi:wsv379 [White spot syndrome virus]|uniref:Wsv379 n=4 Tax=White spot syndrome virus TaxID=342409 RepID=Q8VAM2_WSSVS|nr:wsv379 [Shrimp white spot syndrome virus]AFX59756.1 wsv379 [White spot syndrome virus]AAL33381.1 wsv379 [Shrimp white spot syndrome virus]AAL89306.1 WSSV438 [Shrimp white spot syndrome virus]AWQ60504.1 wsv379 [Shrimp white spot syndrome virus]AWQ60949.1 wsv379 [Shrimp white spot syndrome virus]